MEYLLYFDFRQSDFQWFRFIPNIIMVLVALGMCFLIKKGREAVIAGFILACGMSISSVFVAYNQFNYYQQRYETNDYYTIEGIVTDYKSGLSKEGMDSFRVKGLPFEVHGSDPPPIFTQTTAKGGEIQNGVYVKIIYTPKYNSNSKRAILRIEIKL